MPVISDALADEYTGPVVRPAGELGVAGLDVLALNLAHGAESVEGRHVARVFDESTRRLA